MSIAMQPLAHPSTKSGARMPPQRITSVDILRGVAAGTVCLSHLLPTSADAILAPIGLSLYFLGRAGVVVFFVISGFIVPHSLHRAKYRPRDFTTYLTRRIIRLDPPYLVAALGAAILAYVTAWGTRSHADLSVRQIVSHIGYAAPIFHCRWLNPVFWTLAVEIQFYVVLALAFPILNKLGRLVATVLAAAILSIAGQHAPQEIILQWLPVFALGITAHKRFTNEISTVAFFTLALLSTAAAAYVIGINNAFVAFASATLLITAPHLRFKPLQIVGDFSYSLYLTHVPVATAIMAISYRMPTTSISHLSAQIIAIISIVAATYALRTYVELPAQRFAGRFRYGGRGESNTNNDTATG